MPSPPSAFFTEGAFLTLLTTFKRQPKAKLFPFNLRILDFSAIIMALAFSFDLGSPQQTHNHLIYNTLQKIIHIGT